MQILIVKINLKNHVIENDIIYEMNNVILFVIVV